MNKEDDEYVCIYSAITSSISSLFFGISLTIIGAVESIGEACHTEDTGFFKQCIPLSEIERTSLSSIIAIGALITNLAVNSWTMSYRMKIILNNILYLAGNLLVLTMYSYLTVLIGRFLVGMAVGISCAVIPIYLSKISSTSARGVICSLHSLGIVTGILIGYLLSHFFKSIETWRYAYIIFSIALAVHIPFLTFIISPKSHNSENKDLATISELFRTKNSMKSIITSILIHMGQQFTCITGVIYNSNDILKFEKNPDISTIYVAIVSIISTVCAMFVVDRLGRKLLIKFSCLVCASALLLLIYTRYNVFALFLFMIGYNLGLGPIAWFITGEIFPHRYVKIGTMISVTINWLSNFFVSLTFPFLMDRFGTKCYWLYITFMFFLIIYIFIFFHETKGRRPDFQ